MKGRGLKCLILALILIGIGSQTKALSDEQFNDSALVRSIRSPGNDETSTTTDASHLPSTTGIELTTLSSTTSSEPSSTQDKTSTSTKPGKEETTPQNETISSTVNEIQTTTNATKYVPKKKLVANNSMGILEWIVSIGAIFWPIIVAVGFIRRDLFYDDWLRCFHKKPLILSEHEVPLLKSRRANLPSAHGEPKVVPEASQQQTTNLQSSSHQ